MKGFKHLLFENAAGQKSELGSTFEEILKLSESVDWNRYGFCLDTQHTFAAGGCRFSDHEEVVRMFDEFKDSGLDIGLFHLNDSMKGFGCKVDRHAPVGEGYIWGNGKLLNGCEYMTDNMGGLTSLVGLCREYEIDMVSETSNCEKDMKVIGEVVRMMGE